MLLSEEPLQQLRHERPIFDPENEHRPLVQTVSRDSDAPPETGTEGARQTDGPSFYAESDSATEIALTSESFNRSTGTAQEPTTASAVSAEQLTEVGETTECSSQNTTLLELQAEAKGTKGPGPARNKTKSARQHSWRGVPMREEIFARISWTRSFISGPADPIHNPHMLWCHICK